MAKSLLETGEAEEQEEFWLKQFEEEDRNWICQRILEICGAKLLKEIPKF